MKEHEVIRRLSLYIKYPFIVSLEEFMKKFYGGMLSIVDIVNHGRPDYIERAIVRVKSALNNLKYLPTSFEELELASFHIGLLISSSLGRWSLRRYVDSEAKRSYAYLLSDSSDNVTRVAIKLGVKVEYIEDGGMCGEGIVTGYRGRPNNVVIHCLQYRIPITEYLPIASRLLNEIKWKLVNQYVKNGYVYLNKKEVARLIQEYVKFYLINSTPDLSGVRFEGRINEVIAELSKIVPRELKAADGTRLEASEGIINEDAFPPCIKNIIMQLRNNEHLSHSQRFALATFLINIGVGVDYILELFRHAPDFNEKIARYQIEHLAGLRGSRKKYLSYSCDKMKSLGMCVNDCGVKSLISYYKLKLKSIKMA